MRSKIKFMNVCSCLNVFNEDSWLTHLGILRWHLQDKFNHRPNVSKQTIFLALVFILSAGAQHRHRWKLLLHSTKVIQQYHKISHKVCEEATIMMYLALLQTSLSFTLLWFCKIDLKKSWLINRKQRLSTKSMKNTNQKYLIKSNKWNTKMLLKLFQCL